MKNATKLIAIVALLALFAGACLGQTALSTTTLGAAITDTSSTTVTLTSTSTMQNQGAANQINTCFIVDKEVFGVVTVVDSTHVITQRRGGGCGVTGAGARPTFHASGSKVYFSITANGNTAPSLIGVSNQSTSVNYGSCTASSLLALPRFYTFTGEMFNCFRTGAAGTSGQWVKVGEGTMAPSGSRVSAFCTGTAGSAETEYLNGAACSGATTLTARQLVTTAGTLANLYVVSSAAFTGGTGKDVITVYKNGSATAVTCTAAGAATTCSDTTHSVAVVPGDVIAFQFVSATSDTAANVSAAVGLY